MFKFRVFIAFKLIVIVISYMGYVIIKIELSTKAISILSYRKIMLFNFFYI